MTHPALRRFRGLLLGPAAALLLTLGLAACAPAAIRASVSTDAPFMPGGQQLALICANQGRVAEGGALVWNSGVAQESRPAPYLVSCRDYTLRNDGATLSVQDDTLTKALTLVHWLRLIVKPTSLPKTTAFLPLQKPLQKASWRIVHLMWQSWVPCLCR